VLLPSGIVFFIELKRFKKKASKPQKQWIKRLRKLGFKAGIIAGSQAVTRFINAYVKPS
jgi:hypothetical protein